MPNGDDGIVKEKDANLHAYVLKIDDMALTRDGTIVVNLPGKVCIEDIASILDE